MKKLSVLFLLIIAMQSAAQNTYTDGDGTLRIRVGQVYARVFDDAVNNAENTWKVRARANADVLSQSWLGYFCIQYDPCPSCFPYTSPFNGTEIYNETFGATLPKFYDINVDMWEDDRGDRCTYDCCNTFLDDDDHRCNGDLVLGVDYRAAGAPCQWNNNGWYYKCGSNDYGIRLESYYTPPKPQITSEVNCYTATLTAFTLGAASTAGCTYNWFDQFGAFVGSGSQINVTENGVFEAELSCACGVSDRNQVTVNLPGSGITPVFYVSSVCEEISITGSPGAPNVDYYWYDFQNGNLLFVGNPYVTSTEGTVYVVPYNVVTSCLDANAYTVNAFNNLMELNFAIAGNPCFGMKQGSIDLTVTNGSLPFTYSWSNGSTTDDLFALDAGSYSVTVTDGNGCVVSGTAVVTEPPLLVASVFTSPANCGAANGTASVNVSGGVSPYLYLWSNGNTMPTLFNLSAGTYSITITDANGCVIDEDAIVNASGSVSASITPAGPVSFCKGTPFTLTANTGANYSYQWQKNNIPLAGATAQTYNPVKSGNYKVVVFATGCIDTSAAVSVTVNPKPGATISPQGPTTFCAGSSVDLLANAGTGLTYQWKNGNLNIGGATNQVYTATAAGTYKVRVTNAFGCVKTSAGVVVTVNCKISDQVIEAGAIFLYPNPTDGAFMIEWKSSSFNNEEGEIIVENMLGQIMFTERVMIIDGSIPKLINTEFALANGIYSVRMVMGEEIFVSRLTVQR